MPPPKATAEKQFQGGGHRVLRYNDAILGLAQIPSRSENLGRCEFVLHIGMLAVVSARRVTVADYQICLPSIPSLCTQCHTP